MVTGTLEFLHRLYSVLCKGLGRFAAFNIQRVIFEVAHIFSNP